LGEAGQRLDAHKSTFHSGGQLADLGNPSAQCELDALQARGGVSGGRAGARQRSNEQQAHDQFLRAVRGVWGMALELFCLLADRLVFTSCTAKRSSRRAQSSGDIRQARSMSASMKQCPGPDIRQPVGTKKPRGREKNQLLCLGGCSARRKMPPS